MKQKAFLWFIFINILASKQSVKADILGQFPKYTLLPGYIDFDQHSSSFKNNIKVKQRKDGIERRTPSQILASFLEKETLQFRQEEAEKFITDVKTYQQEAFLTFCSTEIKKKLSPSHSYCKEIDWKHSGTEKKNKHLTKLIKKWKKNEAYLSTNLSINSMLQAKESAINIDFPMINEAQHQDFLENFFTAIEAFEAIKAEDVYWGRASSDGRYYTSIAKSYAEKYSIKRDRVEASNLLIPDKMKEYYRNQSFFSPEQLLDLQKSGYDISTFDPIESGLWRKPTKHSKYYDPFTYDRQGVPSLESRHSQEEIEDLLDREKEISVTFIPSKPSNGQTPKLKVTYGKQEQKWKMKFLTDKGGAYPSLSPITAVQRIILSSETNIEPAVNNLAAMLGFTIDPTYFKKSVRLYLPKEVYEQDRFDTYLEEEVVQVLSSRFKEHWNVRSAFENIKTDEQGKKYLLFKGVSFEKKSDVKTDRGVSLFIRHGLGKSLKREFRALALFYTLIADPDMKDDNVKVKLVPSLDKNFSHKMAFAASDMGISLGFGFPNMYSKKYVDKIKLDHKDKLKEIFLNYHSFFSFPLFDAVSFADARWLLRYIYQIPRENIEKSFLYAGYPDVVATYYTDIFLRRCDQLAKALNMLNKVYLDVDGKKFIIKERSQIKDPKKYTIKGKEEYFEKGNLTDPNNTLFNPELELFPRDWGTKIKDSPDGRHKDGLKRILKKGLVLQGTNLVQAQLVKNFQFSNMSLQNGNAFCKNRCFFAGYKTGLDWFIPMRFVIENPTDSAKDYPYWVVDMFRLAVALGSGSSNALDLLGFSVSNQVLGLGAEFVKGYDFIKIRPVKNYETATKDLKNNEKASRKYIFKNIDEQFLDTMEEGDILVGSSYIGNKTALFSQSPGSIILGGNVETGVESYLTKRIYLMKGYDNNILANWADVKRMNIYSTAYANALFIRAPLLKNEYKLSSQKNRVFRFDLNDSNAKSSLLKNINETNPSEVPVKYQQKSKHVKIRGWNFGVSLFALKNWKFHKGRTEVLGKNFISGERVHELAYERAFQHRVFEDLYFFDKKHRYIKSQINEKGELFAKIDFHYHKSQTYRKDFLKILNKYRATFPSDFIQFDPNLVKYYLGKFDIDSTLIFGPEALKELFDENGPDNNSLCSKYVEINKIDKDSKLWCQKVFKKTLLSSRKHKAKKFIKAFSEARQRYQDVYSKYFDSNVLSFKEKKSREEIYTLEKSITKLLYTNRKSSLTVDLLQDFIKPEYYYRRVSMSSFLEGFPGLIDVIDTSHKYKGSMPLLQRYITSDVDDVFKIFTDEIDEVLQDNDLLERSSIPFLSKPIKKNKYQRTLTPKV